MSLLFYTLGALLAVISLLLLVPVWRAGHKNNAIAYAMIISAASVAIYATIGSPRVVPLVTEHNEANAEIREQIRVTSELIKRDPKNLEAWLTLGKAFEDSGDYAAAANSFKEAVLISKGHPRIIMAYGEALIMQAEGMVTSQAKKSIDIALMIDPSLPLARYYNAVWLLQENRSDEAMQIMKELYAELPDDSSLKQRMKEQIGR